MRWRCILGVVAMPLVLRAQDTTAAKASLLAADRAAAGALTPAVDAVILVPGEPVLHGRAAFAAVLPALTRAPVGHAAWTPAHAVVSRDGTLGCTTGILHRAAADSSQSPTGRYASCWRRDGDGAWRMVAHSRAIAPPAVRSLPDSLPFAPGSTGLAAPRGVNAARAMADADRAFAQFSADSGGPAGAFARWVAPDGMLLGARALPARGPEQARQAFAGFPATGRFEWGPIDTLSRASRDGSLGFTVGEARVAPSTTAVSYSKYLTIWRRQGDGTYRFIFDIGSDRPAPAAR